LIPDINTAATPAKSGDSAPVRAGYPIGLATLALVYTAIRIPYLDFVPLWDGALYHYGARLAFPELLSHANIFAAEVHDHISFVFMLLLGIPGTIAPDSVVLFNLWLLVLSVIAICAFYLALTGLTAGRVAAGERALMTAVFAFHPVITANGINPNLDFGLLLFFLLYLNAFLARRFWLAAIAGTCLVFTKETGVLLLPVLPVAYWIAYPQARSATGLKQIAAVVLIPALALVAYYFLKTTVHGLPFFWQGMAYGQNLGTVDLVLRVFNVPHFDDQLLAQLFFAGILNFQWITTGLLLLLLAMLVWRRQIVTPALRDAVFLGVTTLGVLYMLTRFAPHDNARYLLPWYGVSLLCLFHFLALVTARKSIRVIVTLVLLSFSVVGLYRSVDPMSTRILGTFRFGDHAMYKMTAIARGCCGYGRDQLVYNTQYTYLHYMQNRLYAHLRPGPHTVIVVPWATAWANLHPLDNVTFKRSFAKSKTFTPVYATPGERAEKFAHAENIIYVMHPNADGAPELAELRRHYRNAERFVVVEHGYTLPYWLLSGLK